MSALTSSFTANLVSVKSAAKKSQKVVVGVQASNEFAKKVRPEDKTFARYFRSFNLNRAPIGD